MGISLAFRMILTRPGIKIGTDGFVLLCDILNHAQVRLFSLRSLSHFRKASRNRFTVEEVKAVVAGNDKQRFLLQERGGQLYIRANQGHSLSVPDLDLKPITDAAAYPVVVHGTYAFCLC